MISSYAFNLLSSKAPNPSPKHIDVIGTYSSLYLVLHSSAGHFLNKQA
jgi:hypothetical protein